MVHCFVGTNTPQVVVHQKNYMETKEPFLHMSNVSRYNVCESIMCECLMRMSVFMSVRSVVEKLVCKCVYKSVC